MLVKHLAAPSINVGCNHNCYYCDLNSYLVRILALKKHPFVLKGTDKNLILPGAIRMHLCLPSAKPRAGRFLAWMSAALVPGLSREGRRPG